MDKTIKVLAAAAIIAFGIQSFSVNKADVDLWGNAGFVKAMPWSQEFHRTNTFSFTEPGHRWINHEWLAEYIFHKTYAAFGNTGLLLVKTAIGIAILILLYVVIERQCKIGFLQFLFLMLVISTIGYGFSIRPHLFTYLMIVLFLMVLQLSGSKYHLLGILPLLGLLWTNLHGAFFIGIFLVLIFTVIEFAKSLTKEGPQGQFRYAGILTIVSILLITVSFINPYGLSLWRFIIDSAGTPRPYLSEWAAFNPIADFTDHSDFIAMAVLSFVSLYASSKPKDTKWMTILVLAFGSALIMRRNIPIFAIISCFVIPEHLESAAGRSLEKISVSISKPVVVILLSALISISVWYTLFFNKSNPFQIEVQNDKFPVATVAFMKQNNIRGNLLTFFDWAEYCIWHLHPGCKVFLDGRFTDAYSHKSIADYLAFLYCNNRWENTIREYPVDILLLHKSNDVYAAVSYLKDWKLVCEDEVSGLFLKTNIHSNTLTALNFSQPMRLHSNRLSFFP